MFKLVSNIVALAALAALPIATLARDFRSAEVHPPDYPTTLAVQYMGKLLAEQTKGRLGIRVYASGSLGTEKDTIEQLRIGGLDMMRINSAPLNSVVPESIVTGCRSCSAPPSTCARCSTARSATRSSRRWSRRAWSASRSTTAARARSTR
jgi:hypothetical protein